MRETPLKLLFDQRALAEWHKLDRPIRTQFKKKLEKLVSGEETPSPKNRISGLGPNFYKIKQRASGYRLVYEYRDDVLVITVIAVARRDRSAVYETARGRVKK